MSGKLLDTLLVVFLFGTGATSWAGSSTQFQGWFNLTTQWGGTVQNSNSKYREGDTVPLRFVASLAPDTQHTILLRYDFSSGGTQRFFDALGSFDSTVKDANLLAGISGAGVPSQVALPVDASLPPAAQVAGVLTTYNIAAGSVKFEDYSLVKGVKVLPVKFTVASGGKANKTVVLGYGAHLAAENAWGVGNGASLFPGASRKIFASLDGGSAMNVSVNPGVIVPTADLRAASLVASPEPTAAGEQLAYDLVVANDGPNAAASVWVTNALPAGVTFVSATLSQGTVSSTAPVTLSLGTINAGSSATVRLVVQVGNNPGLSFANTATVSSTTFDPNAANNSATVVSTVRDTTPPVITCPADLTQPTDSGRCDAVVTFTAPATDERGAVTVTCTPPSGSTFAKGTTVVSCVATDAAGNAAACSFSVTVTDGEAPVISSPGTVTTPFGAAGCSLTAAFDALTASDNCDGLVDVVCDPPATALLPLGENIITCTARDAAGNTATSTFTVQVYDDSNQSWPLAMLLEPQDSGDTGVAQVSIQECISILDQSRWFKFSVKPGNRVFVTLTGLPENYDLVLFKDIAAEYSQLTTLSDLVRLNAAFAGDAFAPAAFSPDAFSPGAFAPGAFAPGAFAPGAFAPGAFAPGAFAPGAFAPAAFAPDAYAPGAFAPGAFAPGAFAPGAFAPGAFAPGAFAPGAFAAAQLASVLAVSAFDGIANEGIAANTWDNDGDFYVRVRGRNGVFSEDHPFTLTVYQVAGQCGTVTASPAVTGEPLPGIAGGYKTIIVTDLNRWLGGDAAADAAAQEKLASLAAATDGVVVDMGADPFVDSFNKQADENVECPYGKNLVARAIKGVIDRYWALNPLEYVVIVGSDKVIPFFRFPDEALLGPERNYVPPVKDFTASQASLRLGYVLSQDAYGSRCELPLKSLDLPLPVLAVGRLVETAGEVAGMIDTFVNSGGRLNPTSSLVTGYDFLADAADGVQAELAASLGETGAESLISPAHLSPPECWTADDLRARLFTRRHDILFLAGHFSANGLLAADYTTSILASEFEASSADFANALLYSAGCHSGYNIVDGDAIPYVTLDPDWAQACARKKATLIAGTGYQYGDTEFIEYGERLYLEFTKQLRTGEGPVSIGKALLNAKKAYLAGTPQMRPIHTKSYLQTTIFGLPMLEVDLPGARRTVSPTTPVASAQLVTDDPGATLGLHAADVTVSANVTPVEITLKDTEGGPDVVATYLQGGDGVVSNPAEPTLPLEIRNVSIPGTVLRGVGFRGGVYADLAQKVPLTGAATTEIRGVHAAFLTEVFFPIRPWSVNYFGALCENGGGDTLLTVIPGQFLSDPDGSVTGTLRQFNRMDFRLYYSANIESYPYKDGNVGTPALAAPPAISQVLGITAPDGGTVDLSARVVGDPAAGIQAVWVTFTALSGPYAGLWQSIDLSRAPDDTSLWQGVLPLNGTAASEVRYIVQAVNGVGVAALDTKYGAYHYPDEFDAGSTAALAPTTVQIVSAPAQGAYATPAQFSARLTDGTGQPLGAQRMVFKLGDQEMWATTDSQGLATVLMPLLSVPANYDVKASFPGASGLAPSFATTPFTLTRQTTSLGINPTLVYTRPNAPTPIIATLTDGTGARMPERTILFIVTGSASSDSYAVPVITDASGRAALGSVPLPAGEYTVEAWFNGVIPLPAGPVTVDDGRYLPSTTSGQLNLVVRLVLDDQPPLLVCPANILHNTDPGQCSAAVTFAPLLSDDHQGASVVCEPPSGTIFPVGTTTVHCLATDLAGNSAECSFTVTVVDREAPALLCPANLAMNTDPGTATAVVSFAVSATDNCDPAVAISTSVPSGAAFSIGTTIVTATAVDASGNQSSCSFTVTVLDREPPVLYCSNIAVTTDPGAATAAVSFEVSASDNSGLPVSVLTSVPSGAAFSIGTTTVTATAVDASGNQSSCSFTVTVTDLQPPTIFTVSASPDLLRPPNHEMVPVTVSVTAADNSGAPVSAAIIEVTSSDPINGMGDGDQAPDWEITGPLTVNLRSERSQSGTGRVYTIFVQCTDSAGNTSTGTVTVSVPSSSSN